MAGSAIGGIIGIGGSMIGQSAAAGDRSRAMDLVNQGMNGINGLQVPTTIADPITLQKYVSAGLLTPAQEQAIMASPSMQAQVKANPELQKAQMSALNSLGQLSQTGMTSADKARLNQIQQQTAAQAEGQRQSVLQNFQQRGIGGSGNELLAQLQASQNAANQANQGGLQVAANAQQNALSALGQYGNAAGNMNNQQYQQQSQAAQAQDQLNRFNVQNQQGVQQRNVANQNQANLYNTQNNQNLSNSNVNAQNAEYNRQKQAQQQVFADQLSKATGALNANFMGSNAYTNQANQTANSFSNMGSGFGNIVSGAMNKKGGGDSSGFSDDDMDLDYAHGGVVQCKADGGPIAPAQHQDHLSSMLPMISMLAAHGGKVPGQAPFHGDTRKNDIVPTHLTPGEFVVPKSIMESEEPGENAKKMIELHMALNKKRN